jgi:hypothetical protein
LTSSSLTICPESGRIVIHKTSQYQPEEEAGFRKAAAARSGGRLVWLRSTAFRLIRKGTQEPWRGMLCTLGDESYLHKRVRSLVG